MSNIAPPVKPVTPKVTDEQLLQLLSTVQDLQKKVEAKPKEQVAPEPAPIDWANIEEKDIFDMSLNIPAIDQEVPNYMDLHLKDPAFVGRWVHKMPERLGPMRAIGFDFITKEDWDGSFPLMLNWDSEGHLSYGDVVALKVPKSKYYPALKRNHQKTMAIHGAGKVKTRIDNEVANSTLPLESAFRKGALSVYEDNTKTEDLPDPVSKQDLSSVTL